METYEHESDIEAAASQLLHAVNTIDRSENERQLAEQAAKLLLNINAIDVKPNEHFIWSSGLISPVYSDMRLLISHPLERTFMANELAGIIKARGDLDVIAGTATAGIPHATLAAERLNKPLVYVRGEAKDHGKGNQIEGIIEPGQKVVVVEDLISTGGSSAKTAEAIRDKGGIVETVVSLFNYELPGVNDNMKNNKGLEVYSATNFPAVIRAAEKYKLWSREQLRMAKEWHKNPQQWTATYRP